MIRSVSMFMARASPICRIVNTPIVRININRRPRISDNGAQRTGPVQYPKRKSEVPRTEISVVTPKSCAIATVAEDGAVEANVLLSHSDQQNSQRRTQVRN